MQGFVDDTVMTPSGTRAMPEWDGQNGGCGPGDTHKSYFIVLGGTAARMGRKGLLQGTVRTKDDSAQWVDHVDWR